MSEILCEIISIGDELLIGQVVNTNSSWMAAELNKAGIRVNKITAIADEGSEIIDAIKQAESQSNVILLTGGLGPTKDDITKNVLADYFNSDIIFHEPTYKHIKSLFSKRNYKVTEVNKHQALLPEKCTPLFNSNGTAPGMWFDIGKTVIISMPGVPFEMRGLMIDEVIPRLSKKYNLPSIYHKTVMTTGIGESMLAEHIDSWASSLPSHIKLAYLPQPGIVRLRLSASGPDENKLKNEIDDYCDKLSVLIPKIIFGYNDITLEEVVGSLLKKDEVTLSTAESCTGGYIAHLITSIAGSSNYFKGSIVSYDNDVKVNQLKVNSGDIEKYGAVSQQVVEQMAIGGKEVLKTDYCLATSGIAGPQGGTEEKPVGTVWIAIATPTGVKSKLFNLGEHRGRNIRRSTLGALEMLRRELAKI